MRLFTHLPGVPVPYPDELLYSVLARTIRAFGMRSRKGAVEMLLGSRNVLAVPDLPTHLRLVEGWAAGQWHLSLDDIALHHTAAPYYGAHRGRAEYCRMVRSMRGCAPGLHLRLGICTSVIADTPWFRLCERCVRDDIARRGETYWRRMHQLPGVLVCTAHRTPLQVTSIPYRSPERYPFAAAAPSLLERSQPTLKPGGPTLDLAHGLAMRLGGLCTAPPTDARNIEGYRDSLRQAGYRKANPVERFADDMTLFLGPVLPRLLLRPDADARAWMRMAARTPRRPLHPVVHALMDLFLESLAIDGADAVTTSLTVRRAPKSSRSPDLREQAERLAAIGYRPATIARVLEVDRQTAKRLLAPLQPMPSRAVPDVTPSRRRWLALHRAHPSHTRAQLRHLEPALYARLYRSDREWLMTHGPRRCPARRTAARVNWEARDARLSERVAACAQRLRQERPMRRASPSRILGQLRARALVKCYGRHLPRTNEALRRCSESVEAHQVKRIAVAIANGGASTHGQLLRRAKINPDRLADRGQALIEAAQRVPNASTWAL